MEVLGGVLLLIAFIAILDATCIASTNAELSEHILGKKLSVDCKFYILLTEICGGCFLGVIGLYFLRHIL